MSNKVPRTGLDERHPRIAPRRVTFDFERVAPHWADGNAFVTHMFNSVQLIFPAGERWFVRVFKEALPLIEDERLRDEARGFMAQEAIHARAHAPVYEHLSAHGIDARRASDRIEFVVRRLLGDRPPVPIPRRHWLMFRLGIIAGIEHYTAVMGQWALEAAILDGPGTDPVMADLFRWHGTEEVEHRSVAFDVYQHVSGSHPLRVFTMGLAVIGLWRAIHDGTDLLLRNDPALRNRFRYRHWRRAGREGLLPVMSMLVREAPAYMRRDYHPSKTGSTQQAIDYLLTSPAAKAAGYDPY